MRIVKKCFEISTTDGANDLCRTIWRIFCEVSSKFFQKFDLTNFSLYHNSKMGVKFGTLWKNFYNFPRSFENWGLIWTILADL